MARLSVGEQCSHCKKGSMELHYSRRKNNSGNDSPVFWKCDNPQCEYVMPAKEDEL